MLFCPSISTASTMMVTMSTRHRVHQGAEEAAAALHHHHHLHHGEAVEQHKRDHPDEGGEEEDEAAESEEDDEDCFFESFDRVPSRVSFCLDLPSDDSDEDEDDVRFSFASAVAPPCDFRSVTFSREQFLAELCEEEEKAICEKAAGDKPSPPPGGGFDYDIWMEEPISVKERRRRLLQGMGFASRKIASSRKIVEAPPENGSPAPAKPPLPPTVPATSQPPAAPELPPDPSPQQQPVLTRCRSDSELLTRPAAGPAEPALVRAASAPNLSDYRVSERSETAGEAGIEEVDGGGAVLIANDDPCLVKNPDTGKAFVVSDVDKDGKERLNDRQTGLQVTMEEFERFLGHSPIVKELMRRVKLGGGSGGDQRSNAKGIGAPPKAPSKSNYKKKGGWLKNIKSVASSVTGLMSEKEKGDPGAKAAGKTPGDSSSELMKVRQHGKSNKELTGLYMSQEIQGHQGSIWSIKFSYDGHYLASAGEDRVVQVWQVQECDTVSTLLRRQESRSLQTKPDGTPETPAAADNQQPPKKSTKKSKSKKRSLPDYIVMPEVIFALSEKPVCTFEGHTDHVLDLCWSKSQHLLSSSMDKTVRLWDIENKTCLKVFAHNDYVTCIQFNPVDDRYFISGSLDAKVRIWSIPERQVVDWTDLHEMVTAACYTPDGQGALVGSHKGTCRIYKTSDYKLSQEGQIEIKSKKKKSNAKKITGLQFAPDNPTEVMVTSADSQVRVFDDQKMVHKFRGFRNTSSQIAASYTFDGRYVVCASEDSHVYVWKRDPARAVSAGSKGKGWITTRSHEHFFCKDVSVAIPWPSAGSNCAPLCPPPMSGRFSQQEPLGSTDSQRSASALDVDPFPSGRSAGPPLPRKSFTEQTLAANAEEGRDITNSPSAIGNESFASGSASMRAADAVGSSSSLSSWGWQSAAGSRTGGGEQSNAWGLVVVTAGLGGDIRVFQNFGLPVRLGRPTMFLKDIGT
ncbi:WD repeat-containing protein 44-like [Canna indica]|uniref:WD repeat-containing protein 44-like n=1 Tax=Canna indica TaxID=4628 RepID=A0AAQ3Q3S3_9LILI|nr:WD repeat-containing protein 44-like [Canna indica]